MITVEVEGGIGCEQKKEISDLIGTHRDVLAPDIRINSQGHRVAI
jgi:glutamate dehydrogenase/leucine dehydrogenase